MALELLAAGGAQCAGDVARSLNLKLLGAKTNAKTMAPIKALESMHLIQAGVERDGENMVKKIKGVIQFIIKGGDVDILAYLKTCRAGPD